MSNQTNPVTTTAQEQEQRASVVQVYNRCETSQELKVDGKIYTVQPHQLRSIKGAAGNGFLR